MTKPKRGLVLVPQLQKALRCWIIRFLVELCLSCYSEGGVEVEIGAATRTAAGDVLGISGACVPVGAEAVWYFFYGWGHQVVFSADE